MKRAALVSAFLFVGCASTPAGDSEPEETRTIVQRIFERGPVEVRYVRLPANLTADCNEVPKSQDPNVPFEDEATRLSNGRLAALKECNDRMLKLRQLQGRIVKGN